MAHSDSVVATAANAADIEKAGELIRKDDGVAYGNSGYQGLEKRPEMRLSGVECRINRKKGADRKQEKEICGAPTGHLEYKGIFGFRKVRYRGLKKNLAKLRMLFAGANLLKYAWAGCPDWKPAV